MCGIAGIAGPGAARHAERVRAMVAALAHRGPDDQHVVTFDSCVLGVARLSIIDPPGGRQPIVAPEGDLAVACNGEIYGHRRLRSQLDYPFQTGSDVEVTLALHRRYGARGLLSHLPGTFALAVWDERRHELLLARDRFGERPLHWALGPAGELVFASELKALAASGLVAFDVDRVSLAQALRQGYVPPGRCIWRNVASLKPAHRMVWDGHPRVEPYWEPPAVDHSITAADAAERLRAALTRAVDDQLESDVPLGTFLSGGVDSATVTALAANRRPDIPVFTFDVSLGDSEIAYANDVAERHHLALHTLVDHSLDLPSLLFEVSAAYDEPFGDSSAVLTWLISRFAREHVKVALTGDGADELLGGYLFWARNLLEEDEGDEPPAVDAAGSGWRGRLARWRGSSAPASLRDDPNAGSPLAHRYATWRRYYTAADLAALGLPAVDTEHLTWGRYRTGELADVLRFDLDGYLPGDILVKTDRASMAHSLEVRSPFLDVEVAELCLAMPGELKVDATNEKLPLREAFADLWPPSVRARGKQGFGAPMGPWLADPALKQLKGDLLIDRHSSLFDLVDHDAAQRWVDADDQATWNLLSVAIWWERNRSLVGAA